jgi:hypothetical protein
MQRKIITTGVLIQFRILSAQKENQLAVISLEDQLVVLSLDDRPLLSTIDIGVSIRCFQELRHKELQT